MQTIGIISRILLIAGLVCLGSCAIAPVESDPQKAAERHAAMARDCYKRGGTWNDSVKTCVGADAPR